VSPRPDKRSDLRRVVAPSSVAVVGASTRPGHFARQPLVNLRSHGFSGDVFPVNPKHTEVVGYPCYPRLADLPVVPDLVIVVVRPDLAVSVVRECGDMGVGGAVVVGSGFAETGSVEGIASQRALEDIVNTTGLRLCGPNTLGIANFSTGAVSFASGNLPSAPRVGGIAIVSQSGGCSFTLLNRAWRNGIGVGHMAVAGNELDITIPEFIEYYLRQPEVTSVACYMEAVRDPEGLRRVGALANEVGKSVFVMKSGNSDLGRIAAAAHTGALTSSDAICDIAFEQFGLLRARTFDELIGAAALSARYGRVGPQQFGVYAQGGGLSVVASDLFDAAGLRLAELGTETKSGLKKRMPDTTPGNPFDSGGQFLSAGAGVLTEALQEFAADPEISTMVYMLMPVTGERAETYTTGIVDAARDDAKPSVLLQYGAGAITQQWTDRIVDAGLLLFDPPEAGIAALRLWSGSADRRTRQVAESRRSDPTAPDSATKLIDSWRRAGRRTVPEHDAAALLDIYGIPRARQVFVSEEYQIPRAVMSLTAPYVVKVASDDVPHRSDVGGVRLNLHDEASVHKAYWEVLDNVRTAHPGAAVHGVTIGEAASPGLELIVGVTHDVAWGPTVVLGIGGVFAEVLHDTVLSLPPLDTQSAHEMLGQLRGASLLRGARGTTAVDIDAVVDVIIRVGELAVDLFDDVTAFEINPLIAGSVAGGVVAVDALVELSGPEQRGRLGLRGT
jgi:acyl-CoA synthetase (NDP forming)